MRVTVDWTLRAECVRANRTVEYGAWSGRILATSMDSCLTSPKDNLAIEGMPV